MSIKPKNYDLKTKKLQSELNQVINVQARTHTLHK